MRTILISAIALCLSASAADPSSAYRIKYERQDDEQTITGWGTCFAIGESQALTAAHNVLDVHGRPYATLTMEIAGRWTVVRVIRFDKELDVALLGLDDKLLTPLVLAVEDAKPQAAVSCIASAKGRILQQYEGRVSKRNFEGQPSTLVSIQFDHGFSGAPLFNAAGQVCGMGRAGIPFQDDLDKTCGLFLPASVLRAFLEDQ